MATTNKELSPNEECIPDATRTKVAEQYTSLREAQVNAPDKVFIGGEELKRLDPKLIYLDKERREHPRAWSTETKIYTSAIVGVYCFISPFASTIFAPSVYLVMSDLGIDNSTLGALLVSIFLFAYAIGPLVLAPLSELYGRRVPLLIGNTCFAAFSLGGGFAQTAAQLLVCRFIAGLGGSSTLATVGGVITDIWDVKARPKAQGMIMLGPILGPILGPLCGGWMSEKASWRWTMWVPGIAGAAAVIIGVFFLPETYGPAILQTKVKREKARRPNEQLYTIIDLEARPGTFGYLLSQFVRPVVYLLIDPALFLTSLYYSVIFGVLYLIIVTFPDVFSLGYHHSVGIVGTDFLSIGLGMILATIATVKIQVKLFPKEETGKKYSPESRMERLLSGAPGAILTAAGLFIYGFTALRTHFMVPLFGIFVFSMGSMNVMMAIQMYTVDGFSFAASAFAAVSVFRCIFAGAFPLFGARLFNALGIDWGSALLGFITLGLGLPFGLLLYVYGNRLRVVGTKNMQSFIGKEN